MKLRTYMLLALALPTTMLSAQQKKKPAATKRQPKTTAAIQMTAKQKELFETMLPNTQKIFFIDSVVVDKNKVADAIPMPADYGKIMSCSDFFGKPVKGEQYVFLNGFGNKCFYTELDGDSIQRLYSRDKLGEGWSEAKEIREIDSKYGDVSNPFMSSDGQTLYFAATSSESLGKRDIYMAKYDAEEGKFLEPENIGLPFNSTDDDYFYVEADADGFAWFATTRRQPAGKACVYTFVLPKQRQNYSSDDLSETKLKSLASVMRIRETWPTPEIRDKQIAKLEKLKSRAKAHGADGNDNVEFVVNDNTVYHSINDFRSDATRKLFYEVIRLSNDLRSKQSALNKLRSQYHAAAESERSQLGNTILQLEQQMEQSRAELKSTSASLRAAENKLLKE